MNVGTKSLLWGYHTPLIHAICVAKGWKKGFGYYPRDKRIWLSFLLHDIGYIGKPNMDLAEGETHPELGATIMGELFGEKWYRFTVNHSRRYASLNGDPVSDLWLADKLAFFVLPWWAIAILVRLSGEMVEYQAAARYEHGRKLTAREWVTWIRSMERARIRQFCTERNMKWPV
jgi:hypothetical protein